MDTCVVDIVYEFDCSNKFYIKKVVLCGILKSGRSFVKQIVYNYPSKKSISAPASEHDSRLCNVFGNGEIRRNDEELVETLSMFKLVIASSRSAIAHLTEYCPTIVYATTQSIIDNNNNSATTITCDQQ